MYSNAKSIFLSNQDINLLSFNAQYSKNIFNTKLKKLKLTKRKKNFFDKSDLIISNKIGPTSGAIISTDILKEINSFDPKIKIRQDYSNWLLICNKNSTIYTSSELGFFYETDINSSIHKFNPIITGISIANVWKIRFKVIEKFRFKYLFAFFYDVKFIIAKILERLPDNSFIFSLAFLYNLTISLSFYFIRSLYLFIVSILFYKN